MKKRRKISLCVTAVMVLILTFSICALEVWGEKFMEEFKALISSNTIKVGQSAVVTLTGGQLDVAGYHAIGDIGEEFAFASIVEVVQTDKNRFEVKGVGPGNAVLKFSDGKNETTVKIRVLEK